MPSLVFFLRALLCAVLILPLVLAQESAESSNLAGKTKQALHGLWQGVTRGSLPINLEARSAADTKAGVTRLSDSNYTKVFADSDPSDVWVVLVHGQPGDPMSGIYQEVQANASALMRNHTTTEGDAPELPNFRFARIDYVSEWAVCSRWLLTKAQYYVFVSNKGKDLRFIPAQRLPPQGEVFYRFLTTGSWERLKQWSSSFRPGGDNSYIVEGYIALQTRWTELTANIPSWVFVLVTGTVGQSIFRWLHSGGQPAAAGRQPRRP